MESTRVPPSSHDLSKLFSAVHAEMKRRMQQPFRNQCALLPPSAKKVKQTAFRSSKVLRSLRSVL